MMVVFKYYGATPQSRDFRWPVLEYIGNPRASRFTQARGLRDFGGNRLDINTEPSALDLAVRPEFRQLRLHQVDRDGEADTHVHAGARVDLGGHRNHQNDKVDE